MTQLDARTIRIAMWGILLIWIGVMMVIDPPPGVASIGAGSILLAASVFRKAMGWRAGFVLTLMGILLIGIGIGNLRGDGRGIPLLAVALIAFGALIVVRALGARNWIRRHTHEVTIHLPQPPRDDP